MNVTKLIHIVLLVLTSVVFIKPPNKHFKINMNNEIISYSIICSLIILMYIDPLSTILLTLILIQLIQATECPKNDLDVDEQPYHDNFSTSYLDTSVENNTTESVNTKPNGIENVDMNTNINTETDVETPLNLDTNNQDKNKVVSDEQLCDDTKFLITLEMLNAAQNNVFDEKNDSKYINYIGDSNANIQGVYNHITGYNSLT
jgi:hypothetical protein